MLRNSQGFVHIRFEEHAEQRVEVWLDIQEVHVGPVEIDSARQERLGKLLDELVDLICAEGPRTES